MLNNWKQFRQGMFHGIPSHHSWLQSLSWIRAFDAKQHYNVLDDPTMKSHLFGFGPHAAKEFEGIGSGVRGKKNPARTKLQEFPINHYPGCYTY